ncbi:hypothetical protein ASZ78_003587 [Callipepla squamata]|uniref:BRCT domain-containing protein n=1 Tax=Callipepla squamata TaxID=9009 RepID=A0A226MY28_CALSU|nr:hypothetical protein ASZ78_003587 [Callipepla squamata]
MAAAAASGGRAEGSAVRRTREPLKRPAPSARSAAALGVPGGGQQRRIQLTGFRKKEKKALREALLKMDCVFVDSKKYSDCTHLIAKKLCKSEKFLAACAAGKWILTKEYIINSAESGRWLDETTYEWGYKIEKDTHYSPQMQSAPKRWRKELKNSGAPGAFHGWKVILAVEEGYELVAPVRRVLEAGKATVCSPQDVESGITHVFTLNNFFPVQKEKYFSEALYCPLQYIGDYLLEDIQNTEVTQINGFLPAQETDKKKSNMQLIEMKNAVIKHMFFVKAAKQNFAHQDFLNKCNLKVKCTNLPKGRLYIFEELIEENLLPEVIIELAVGQKYFLPPVQLLHSLLERVLLENIDAVFCAKLHHVLYLVLQHDPPWKSTSMLEYYLDLLQCPICKKGTWNLIEMLLRSCLHCKSICHAVPVSGKADEQRTLHTKLLKFFFDIVKAEVEILTKSLVEGTNSQQQQVMPQTVLLKTFWLGSETSVLFTKPVNMLVDWVILSYRELERKNDAFRHEIACLLNAILGTVVDYWIVSGLLMDRNVLHQVAEDLAHYIAIASDGQTALHGACIRNKVERLIQLLSSPGIDINSKDYAGWTPLHEACNHGSTVCVSEILQRCPEVDLLSQVDGVTALHDALSNGHVEIGKLLLQHGGPVLLQQRDSNGKLPLDYVQSLSVKQELLNIVHPEESIESFYERMQQDLSSQQRELWLFLFNKMVLNFCSVYNLFSPLTLREVARSSVLPVTAADICNVKGTLPAHWLVDTYFRELETFQKLPQFIEEVSAFMHAFPGEQIKALLATLETVVKANQLFA